MSTFEKLNTWVKHSITVRLITIGILILLFMTPISMVEEIIMERESTKMQAVDEVSSKWGREQTIKGLVLTIPFKAYSKEYEDDTKEKFTLKETIGYAHFLPNELNISGDIQPEIRYRGIYEVIVYNSKVKLTGSFSSPTFDAWKIDTADIMWEDAFVSLGLSDLRSIQEDISVDWNGKKYNFNPGVESEDVIQTGISANLRLSNAESFQSISNFSLELDFNGSSSLNFIPLGKTTKVNIVSKWQNPSFIGSFLPDTRDVNTDGFSASWNVLHLNRSYPQQFIGTVVGMEESSFGVDLFMPVDEYQKSTRSVKYAIMFITLTFLVFFFIQILNAVNIHPIQYLIVGLALCIFYTLLIALSEHISFSLSYFIASISIISMVTFYAKSMFNKTSLTRMIFLMLTALYVYIYTIIQMEDYALLMGSVGLLVVLGSIMYLSRKIDWYAIHTKSA
jgi:inner membrane protein